MTITCCLKSDNQKQNILLRHSEAESEEKLLRCGAACLPALPLEQSPFAKPPLAGRTFSGDGGWVGALLSSAQSG